MGSHREKDVSALLPKERLVRIYELIERQGSAKTEDLSRQFNTSLMTIRRDLAELERKGLVTRTHGGVLTRQGILADLDVDTRKRTNIEKKRAIAQAAMHFIQPGEAIAMDASTTVVELAKLLVRMQDITVITNNMMVANVLAKPLGAEIFFAGGKLRREALSTVGPLAEHVISQCAYSKAFVSGTAMDLEVGLMDSDPDEVHIKQIMLHNAIKRYLLVDSAKIGRRAVSIVWPLKDFDAVITDSKIDDKSVEAIRQANIPLVVASPDEGGL